MTQKTKDPLEDVFEITDDLNAEHKKSMFPYEPPQLQTADEIRTWQQLVDDDLIELQSKFNEVNDVATEQKNKQNEVEELVKDVIGKKNNFFEDDGFWWEDDIFDARDSKETVDVSKILLDEVKEMQRNIIDKDDLDLESIDDRNTQELADDDFIEIDNRIRRQLQYDDYIELESPKTSDNDYDLNLEPIDDRNAQELADGDFIEIENRTRRQLQDNDYIELESPLTADNKVTLEDCNIDDNTSEDEIEELKTSQAHVQ